MLGLYLSLFLYGGFCRNTSKDDEIRYDVSVKILLFFFFNLLDDKVNLYAIVPIHFFIIVMRSKTHTYYTLGTS